MKKHVVGFRHVGIITEDIDKSLLFYRDILGLEVIQEFEDSSDYTNEITNLKKLLKSLKKEIIKFKKKFFENLKK